MAIAVTASVDGLAASRLDAALALYAASMGEKAADGPKRAAIYLCDSLRARTKKAPTRARPSEYAAAVSVNPPPYITYKNGRKLATPLHRWSLTRKLGTPAQYTKDHFVYCHYKSNRSGRVVADRAAELRELKKLHLGIAHAGLAKISWNKIKGEIIRGSSDVVWAKRKGDRREPLKDVRGAYRKSGGVSSGGIAVIKNHIDYIEAALKPGAYAEAVDAAANKLEHFIRAATKS